MRPDHRTNRLSILLVLGGLSAFGPFCLDMYLPSLPSLGASLHTGAAQAQLTLTACLIGLAAGQLVVGPISDTLGRRRPLLIGLAVFTVTSLLGAITPSVWVLVALRLLQGAAGGAGVVIARAMVRDQRSGADAARYFALLMLVNGVAPIVAPVFGGQLLRVTSWRGVFVVLAGIGVVLAASAATVLTETLPVGRRHAGGLRASLSAFGRLAGDRVFVGYAAAGGFTLAAMFAYISGSSFVLQNIFGVSPQVFSAIFASNAFGIVLASQLSRVLIDSVGARRLCGAGVCASAAGGLGLLAVLAAGVGLPGVLPCLFVTVSSVGLVLPTSTALALQNHARNAGSASGVLGVAQYLLGGAVTPIVGIAGSATGGPMAIVMATLGVAAVVSFRALTPALRTDRG